MKMNMKGMKILEIVKLLVSMMVCFDFKLSLVL